MGSAHNGKCWESRYLINYIECFYRRGALQTHRLELPDVSETSLFSPQRNVKGTGTGESQIFRLLDERNRKDS